MVTTELGMVMLAKDEQFMKASFMIYSIFSGNLMLVRPVQSLKAW